MRKPSNSHKLKGTTQEFIEIEDVSDDVVILRDGSCAIVVETTAVNFNLLSREEQEAIIAGFASLLNSLSFSIQIVIHSRMLDLSSYLASLDEKIQGQTNQLLKTQMEKYRFFVEGLMSQNTILDKRFYIAIPFSPIEVGVSLKKIDRQLLLEKAKYTLYPKRDQVVSLLSRIGLGGKTLSRGDLIALFYSIFSPKDLGSQALFQDVKTALAPIVKIETK